MRGGIGYRGSDWGSAPPYTYERSRSARHPHIGIALDAQADTKMMSHNEDMF